MPACVRFKLCRCVEIWNETNRWESDVYWGRESGLYLAQRRQR